MRNPDTARQVMQEQRWTFVIAYYNEAEYLPQTLESLAEQTLKPFRLILVDNGSTDGSAELSQASAAFMPDVEVIHLSESRPGKIHALEAAMPHIATPLVAFGDADTWYPPDYLATADREYAKRSADLAGVMAIDLPALPASFAGRRKRFLRTRIAARLWPRQTHSGGFGQTFRSAALIAAGGYSEKHWRYVLLDHEVMHRVLKRGRVIYPADFWCIPSQRRSDRRRVRWTLAERLLYHLCPFAAKDWYFHRFLGPRLERRRLSHLNLRDRPWERSTTPTDQGR